MKKFFLVLSIILPGLLIVSCSDDEKIPEPTGISQKNSSAIVDGTLHIVYNSKLDLNELFTLAYESGVTPPAELPALKFELTAPVKYVTKKGGKITVPEQTVQPFVINGSRLTTVSTYPIPLTNGDRVREVQLAQLTISDEAGKLSPITIPVACDDQPGQIVAIRPFNNSSLPTPSAFYRHVEGTLYRAAVGRSSASQAVNVNTDFEVEYADGSIVDNSTLDALPIKIAAVDFGTKVVEAAKINKYPGTVADEPLGNAGYLLVYPATSDSNDVATLQLDIKIVKMVGVESISDELLNDGTAARTFLVRAEGVTTANHPSRYTYAFLNGIFNDGYIRAYNSQDNFGTTYACTVEIGSTELEGQTPQAAIGPNAFRTIRLKAAIWTDPSTVGRAVTFTASPENHYNEAGWVARINTTIKPAQ
ncbi:MAG: hypothetical protein LBR67_06630 [Dysgonamonadaceae bacterium]|nr:hypothetical protein [Dysgonamonadaceae bacterium]